MPDRTDAIFLVLGGVLLVGMVNLISSERLYPSPKNMGPRKKLTIQIALSIAVCIFGFINIIFIRRSGHSSATGAIVGLRQHIGKHNYSKFSVQREDGSSLSATCDYDYNRLILGETVRVEVLNYQSTLLHLSVLDGPYKGWNLSEGDGTSGSEIAMGYGFLAALIFFLKRQRIVEASPDQLRDAHGSN